jgi:hypothetical protein
MPTDDDLYTARLLKFWDPRYFGFHRCAYTHGASETSPVCGDEVEFRLVLKDDQLEVVDVKAHGCCVSECCAAMLADLVCDRPLSWINHFLSDDHWTQYVNVPLGKSRRDSCMMLPLRCLRKALVAPYQSVSDA